MAQSVVPNVMGLPASTAESVLSAAGFRMSPSAPWGSNVTVRTQAPPGGTPYATGSTVNVIFNV